MSSQRERVGKKREPIAWSAAGERDARKNDNTRSRFGLNLDPRDELGRKKWKSRGMANQSQEHRNLATSIRVTFGSAVTPCSGGKGEKRSCPAQLLEITQAGFATRSLWILKQRTQHQLARGEERKTERKKEKPSTLAHTSTTRVRERACMGHPHQKGLSQ